MKIEIFYLQLAKKKIIKVWTLPKEWRDKELEAHEEREHEHNVKQKNIMVSQQTHKAREEDSDEDDLAGWHKY